MTNGRKAFSQYGLNWCVAVRRLMKRQEETLRENGLEQIFLQVELPLIEVLASMEVEGFSVDKETLEQFGIVLKEEIGSLENQIYALAGKTFNINSPLQL